MLLVKRPIILVCSVACLLGVLTSCANSPTGNSLERSFAADPRLSNNPNTLGSSPSSTPQASPSAQLPDDFPSEIPRYPDAQLQEVEQLTVPNTQGERTTWTSSDPINAIVSFYQRAFESGSWQIVQQPTDESGTFVVRRNDLQVTVSIPSTASSANTGETPATQSTPSQTNSSATQFDIQYIRNATTAEQTEEQPSTDATASSDTTTSTTQSQTFTDLDKVPTQLRQYVEDLAVLGVLTVEPSSTKTNTNTTGTQFDANKTITRREFARWLVAANNQIHANDSGQQIRLASENAQPAFKDVAKTDPDFASIQALAEAGLIPSPLSGDTTAVLFRPDAPLTRENLLLWKVPLDLRQALPSASVDAVKQTWGFQDAAKIDPKALRAVLADFQNADQSNIKRMFGFTTLFQPKRPVSRAESAAALWYFGSQGEGLSAKEAQQLKSNPTPEASPETTQN